jgi:hypothetical protein
VPLQHGLSAMGTRAARVGVKRGLEEGQKEKLGDGPPADSPTASAKRRAPVGVPREVKDQVGVREGPAGWPGAHDGLPRGLRKRRGTGDLAAQAEGESSGGIIMKTNGQTGQEPYRSAAGACDARPGWDQQVEWDQE